QTRFSRDWSSDVSSSDLLPRPTRRRDPPHPYAGTCPETVKRITRFSFSPGSGAPHHELLVEPFTHGTPQTWYQNGASVFFEPHPLKKTDRPGVFRDGPQVASRHTGLPQMVLPLFHQQGSQTRTARLGQKVDVQMRRPPRIEQLTLRVLCVVGAVLFSPYQ